MERSSFDVSGWGILAFLLVFSPVLGLLAAWAIGVFDGM